MSNRWAVSTVMRQSDRQILHALSIVVASDEVSAKATVIGSLILDDPDLHLLNCSAVLIPDTAGDAA